MKDRSEEDLPKGNPADRMPGATDRLPESHRDIRRVSRQPVSRLGVGLVVTAVLVLVMLVLMWRLLVPGTDGTGMLPDDIDTEQTTPAQPLTP
jgi:hypothetical protein